jgi:lipoprotein-releasing system permease protein
MRYFKARKNERFISIVSGFSLIGVMLGVASLIIVMSVMKGFERDFTKMIIGLNGDISIISHSKIITDYENIKILLKEDYILHIDNVIIGQALAIGKSSNSGALIRGIDIVDLKHKGNIMQGIISGSFDDFVGTNVIAIGSELSHSLDIHVGDKLKLLSPNIIATPFGNMPRSKEFNVVAVFNSGMYDYDATTILMPLAAARNFLLVKNGVNLIEITTKYPEKADIFARKIQDLLDNVDFQVTSWQKTNAQFLNALAIERISMFAILSLIIAIAAFNIISSLFMLVKDKTKDIAILRTIGASKQQIMLIFICNGMFIGFFGTFGGILLGSGFAYNIETIKNFLERITDSKIFDPVIYFLYRLPSDVRIEDIILISSLSLLLCFVATIYPAYMATKCNPIDAMRYE